MLLFIFNRKNTIYNFMIKVGKRQRFYMLNSMIKLRAYINIIFRDKIEPNCYGRMICLLFLVSVYWYKLHYEGPEVFTKDCVPYSLQGFAWEMGWEVSNGLRRRVCQGLWGVLTWCTSEEPTTPQPRPAPAGVDLFHLLSKDLICPHVFTVT